MTKKALVSVADDGSSRVMPFWSSRSWALAIDSAASGVVSGLASGPFSVVLRKSTMPPTYSGTTSMVSGNCPAPM